MVQTENKFNVFTNSVFYIGEIKKHVVQVYLVNEFLNYE